MSKDGKKITRNELVELVYDKCPHFKKYQVDELVNAAFDTLADAICTGNLVTIRRLGRFIPKIRPPRKARNPSNGETLICRALHTVRFKMGYEVKDRLAER
jgi:nucleoid DNA-binding protein